jgi:hypothetical protein
MTLVVTAGEPGVGKSTQHVALCKMLPESIYLCMEVKDDKLLRLAEINAIKIVQYDHSYNEDPVGTLNELEIAIHKIITENKYKNVILDGISDIRKFAMKEWIYKDNQMRKDKPRTMISGENLAAWSAINQRVTLLLEPLINWANIKGTNVFFTAQMKDSYLNNNKVGRQIAAQDWIEYDVDVRCLLVRDSRGYIAKLTKLPGWAIGSEEEKLIDKDTYLMFLAEKGLI